MSMIQIALIALLVAAPLSVFAGVDSRIHEERPRSWWAGSRR